MKVVFDSSDAEAQLHLTDRKLIAARLVRLISVTEARLDAPSGPSAAVRKFARDTESAIRDVLEQHAEELHEPAVDKTLSEINSEVQARGSRIEDEDVAAGRKAFDAGSKLYSCGDCSAHADRICRGLFSDWKLFEDGQHSRGGLCIGFVRELAEHLLAYTETALLKYGELTLRPRSPLAKLTLSLRRLDEGHDGTLPLEGSYDPDTGEMLLQMPADLDDADEIDEALLMLPYLLFHELFVHGGQGRALPQTIGPVPYDCAFTEGAVDAAARELLQLNVLPESLPEPYSAIRMRVLERCKTYGEQRSHLPRDSAAMSEGRRNNAKIRRARSYGMLTVWDALRKLEMRGSRPGAWKIRILTKLNLLLTTEQRDDFMMAVGFWEALTPEGRDGLLIIFDQFLENCRTTELLDRLDALGGP